MTDQERLSGYVDVWWQAVDDFTGLLEQHAGRGVVDADRPGRVGRPCRGHIAHLEAVLAGSPEETVEVGEPDHVTGLMGVYTEQGVVARRDRPRRDHQRDPLRRRRGTRHCSPTRPRTAPPSPTGSSAASAGTGTRCCATARSTCGCTSRTYAAPSAAPAGWTRRPRGPRRSTSPRASASWSPSGSAPRPARPWCWRSPAANRSRSPSTSRAAASGSPRSPPTRPWDWPWTARRSSCSRADGAAPSPAPSRSPATPPSARRSPTPGGHAVKSPATCGVEDMPDQAGRTIVVTGTTIGGLGFETALEFAPPRRSRGPRRTHPPGSRSPRRRSAPRPAASLERVRVDVSDLSSVRRAAARLSGLGPISALVNNAGVMGTAYTGPGTASSCRWRPTTSGRSCSRVCSSRSWSRATTRAS